MAGAQGLVEALGGQGPWGRLRGCQGPGNLVSDSKFSPTGFVELGWGLAKELEKGPNLVEEGVQAPCPQPSDTGGI